MINVDLRRYGNDPEYAKMINGYISGADIDESQPSIYKLLPDKPSIYKLLPNHEMDRTTILQNRIEARSLEKKYELSKEMENWNGCYPDPNLGHGENWEKEGKNDNT